MDSALTTRIRAFLASPPPVFERDPRHGIAMSTASPALRAAIEKSTASYTATVEATRAFAAAEASMREARAKSPPDLDAMRAAGRLMHQAAEAALNAWFTWHQGAPALATLATDHEALRAKAAHEERSRLGSKLAKALTQIGFTDQGTAGGMHAPNRCAVGVQAFVDGHPEMARLWNAAMMSGASFTVASGADEAARVAADLLSELV
jgi:hypothetical protein